MKYIKAPYLTFNKAYAVKVYFIHSNFYNKFMFFFNYKVDNKTIMIMDNNHIVHKNPVSIYWYVFKSLIFLQNYYTGRIITCNLVIRNPELRKCMNEFTYYEGSIIHLECIGHRLLKQCIKICIWIYSWLLEYGFFLKKHRNFIRCFYQDPITISRSYYSPFNFTVNYEERTIGW